MRGAGVTVPPTSPDLRPGNQNGGGRVRKEAHGWQGTRRSSLAGRQECGLGCLRAPAKPLSRLLFSCVPLDQSLPLCALVYPPVKWG